MSIVFHLPTNCALSLRKNARRGNWTAMVISACTTLRLSTRAFQSPNIPDGMSMEITVAPDSLMWRASDLNPPSRGSRRPVPKSPSITRWSGLSVGISARSIISVRFTFPRVRSCCFANRQSRDRLLPFTLNSRICGLKPASIRSFATMRASAPLLPDPAKITVGFDGPQLARISLTTPSATRWISSCELTPSSSMVMRSILRMLSVLKIFISASL